MFHLNHCIIDDIVHHHLHSNYFELRVIEFIIDLRSSCLKLLIYIDTLHLEVTISISTAVKLNQLNVCLTGHNLERVRDLIFVSVLF
jgi:hypothetical protein